VKSVKTCSRCIYDESVPAITFDENGICNYCKTHEQLEQEYPTGEAGREKLEELAENVRKSGRGKQYDCVVGISGGCDSSYLLHITKEKLGLRPIAVHFDNTWNSKTAVENIDVVLSKLDIPLWTYVMDNHEYNDLARSMLLASVPEIDALTDIALVTTLYMAAEKFKVKYIFDGHSFRTEGITPLNWFYFDGKYIDSIHGLYGRDKMECFPNLWLRKWVRWLLMNIKRVRPLYYVDYNKEEVKQFLTKEYRWKWYKGHHHENRYCAFNHWLLREKFSRDLRYVEFSAMIRSGQMTREQALEEIQRPPEYPDELISEVKKRLEFSDEEFERILKLPVKSAKDYSTYLPTFRRMKPFFWIMYKADLVPKSFYMKYCR
jgi:N-acetyl sugar amidotransferase